MKKYFVILGFTLVALVCGCGLALANPTTEETVPEETMTANLAETISAAETAMFYGPESVLDETADIVTTENEAIEVYEEYEAGLGEIFTASEKTACIELHENYPEEVEMRDEIISESNNYLLEVVGFGHFDIEILDYTMDGDTAVVNVAVTDWSKRVTQRDSGFEVTFPVNKCIEKVQMMFESGTWKYDKWEIISDFLMDSDEDLAQTFPTYEEAVAYANSVTPKNVLADKIV